MFGKLTPWLRLIRLPNLLIIAFIFITFRWGLIYPLEGKAKESFHFLNNILYILLCLSVILVAAGGYIINNIQDRFADQINKPHIVVIGKGISEKQAYNSYYITSFSGILLGIFLGWKIDMFNIGMTQAFVVALLWLYSTQLKGKPLIGNFVVAFLAFIAIVIIPLFDLFPLLTPENKEDLMPFLSVYLAYGTFAFFVTLAREMAKDLEDREGDQRAGYQTFAIIAPMWANKVFIVLCLLLTLGGMFLYMIGSYKQAMMPFLYILFGVFLPSLFTLWLSLIAKTKRDFEKISLWLKWIMVTGIFSVAVFSVFFVLGF